MRTATRPERTRLIAAVVLVLGPAAVAVACSDSDDAKVTATTDGGIDAPAVVVPEASIDAPAIVDAAADVVAPRGRNMISQTGLYADIASKTIASDAIAYTPEFILWSDGADKKRWIRLPAGSTIDTTDPDRWVFPVGTQLFKEFSLDGKRLETRLVERLGATGNDQNDYFLGAFLWRDDESDADFVVDGAMNVRATPHDVPPAALCWTCHIGEPGHVLGFSALQLSNNGFLDQLHTLGFLATPIAEQPLPGTPTERAGIGYIHANCGHCHNENGSARTYTDMILRVRYGETIADSGLAASTIGMPTRSFSAPGITARIAPGDPDASCVAFRPSIRGSSAAMPPIATEFVDDAGVDAIRAWIASLPYDAGVDLDAGLDASDAAD